MTKILTPRLETAKAGYANGISTFLQEKQSDGDFSSLTEYKKKEIIDDAAFHYGKFLTALGVNWEEDPNSSNTPHRVAKAYVNELWKGRYNVLDSITTFPSDNYNGIVLEKDIPLHSMCSHHHLAIDGYAHIGYIPGNSGQVIGLSKINRIVEHFSRRGSIQEQLTVAIHNALDTLLEGNEGIIAVIQATHGCVSCRGVKHNGASMITSEVSGAFADHKRTAKSEVFSMLDFKLGR
jgi:GTP cyclohydrolase I